MKPKKKTSGTAKNERAHIFYSGRVQGVGFRYTAEKFALDLELTGWVKNLPDNRVELLCEGPKAKIEELMQAIQQSHLGKNIQKVHLKWLPATDEFTDFQVEFY